MQKKINKPTDFKLLEKLFQKLPPRNECFILFGIMTIAHLYKEENIVWLESKDTLSISETIEFINKNGTGKLLPLCGCEDCEYITNNKILVNDK